MKCVKNKLRVLHYPQIPCEPFVVNVKDEEQAFLIVETLGDQHLFLYDNDMIPDYSNVIIVEMFDGDFDGDIRTGWSQYWNEEESMDFDEFAETYFLNAETFDNSDIRISRGEDGWG